VGHIGRVAGLEAVRLPDALDIFDCRNHRLAWLGLHADGFIDAVRDACARHGARRVGVVVGTSTSGILTTEEGYRSRDPDTGQLPLASRFLHTHNFGALAEFVRVATGTAGPVLAISTACSSSAKAFASAARWIAAGLVDAVVVGGVDSLCGTTLHGFASLQLIAPTPCRPFDAHRDGISLGEAAAFVLVEAGAAGAGLAVLGYGESSDAHHMSAPHPEGVGAERAMRDALAASGETQVDYVLAHGTATRNNDGVEAHAIRRVCGDACPITSVKGYTGHTLGAAGAVSAVIALGSIERGHVPGTVNTHEVDPDCGPSIAIATRAAPVRRVLVNAFGFGGSNASLVVGAVA